MRKEENNINLLTSKEQEISDAAKDINVALTEITHEIKKNQPWYLYSRATRHVTGNKEFLELYTPNKQGSVTMAGGKKHCVEGSGSTKICTKDGEIKLREVLYVPSFKKNLISLRCLAQIEKLIAFSNNQCWIMSKHNKLTLASHQDEMNGLYRIKLCFLCTK